MILGSLTDRQRDIVGRPIREGETVWVQGPAGAGKTTALEARLLYLLSAPVRGESILALVPDRGRREPLIQRMTTAGLGPHGRPAILTYYGLARQMVELFWPAVAGAAGFAFPNREPTFLAYETAQYLMHQVAQPLVESGYFAALRVRPRRLTSQLLDNLNKAAINAFSHEEIGERLSRADADGRRIREYAEAQECANRFRRACLQRNALDVSLTIEVFHRHLLPESFFWAYFSRHFRHLVVDNVEETVPVAQDLIRRLLATCDSATLAYDERGGYRIMLGVNPDSARELRGECRSALDLPPDFVPNLEMPRLAWRVAKRLGQTREEDPSNAPLRAVAGVKQTMYRSEMIAWIADRIADLIENDGARPADIAVICPYADGVLRFTLQESLRRRGVPFTLVRRWISFRDDVVARGLLTLAALAHPTWVLRPRVREVAEALHIAIPALDLARATLLTSQVYRPTEWRLLPATEVGPRERERIGFAPVEVYGRIYEWLEDYRATEPAPLDRFLSLLFESLLCDPAFWGTGDPTARRSCARLIESARAFRLATPAFAPPGEATPDLGREYLRMVDEGIVAGSFFERAPADDASVLLVTPVYAYLLDNRESDYQFWVDVGSREWWRPPQQPLTNPVVLSRYWDPSARWDAVKDEYLRNWLLARMVEGLTARCRRGIFLCGSDVDSVGNPQDGPLFPALMPLGSEDSS